jgi:hypothetical protein
MWAGGFKMPDSKAINEQIARLEELQRKNTDHSNQMFRIGIEQALALAYIARELAKKS